jgi:hypothetical protein
VKEFLTTVLLFNAFILSGCATTVVQLEHSIPTQEYSTASLNAIYLIQDGQAIEAKDGVYHLSKAPFQLLFEHDGDVKLLINAWTMPETYDVFLGDNTISDMPGFEHTGMAEYANNLHKHLTLSSNVPNAWFYDQDGRTRFDKNETIDGKVRSTRTIENLNFQKAELFKISEVDFQDLYLSLVEYKYYPDGMRYEALVKSRIHLKFQ